MCPVYQKILKKYKTMNIKQLETSFTLRKMFKLFMTNGKCKKRKT